MKNLKLFTNFSLSLLCLFSFNFCKVDSERNFRSQVESYRMRGNRMLAKYNLKEDVFKVDEIKFQEWLNSHNDLPDDNKTEMAIVEYMYILNPVCGMDFYKKEIYPKLILTESSDERLDLIKQYKNCFAVPDSLLLKKD